MDATTKRAIEMANDLGMTEIIDTDKGAVFVFGDEETAETYAYRAQREFRGSMVFSAEGPEVYVRWVD